MAIYPSGDVTWAGGPEERLRFRRRPAGGTSFESGFMGIGVIKEGLLTNIHQTRDNRGNLVAQRRDGGL